MKDMKYTQEEINNEDKQLLAIHLIEERSRNFTKWTKRTNNKNPLTQNITYKYRRK